MSSVRTQKVAALVRDAGGRVVGRTRLQKIAYLLCMTGLEDGISFAYKHYGPYSEELAFAARQASLLNLLSEIEYRASWGGTYSVFSTEMPADYVSDPVRFRLIKTATDADSVVLELAATAVFLAKEGFEEPWSETERRKPEKAENGMIGEAKKLYQELCMIETPTSLPSING